MLVTAEEVRWDESGAGLLKGVCRLVADSLEKPEEEEPLVVHLAAGAQKLLAEAFHLEAPARRRPSA